MGFFYILIDPDANFSKGIISMQNILKQNKKGNTIDYNNFEPFKLIRENFNKTAYLSWLRDMSVLNSFYRL